MISSFVQAQGTKTLDTSGFSGFENYILFYLVLSKFIPQGGGKMGVKKIPYMLS